VWQEGFDKIRKGSLDPMPVAKSVQNSEREASPVSGKTRGAALVERWQAMNP